MLGGGSFHAIYPPIKNPGCVCVCVCVCVFVRVLTLLNHFVAWETVQVCTLCYNMLNDANDFLCSQNAAVY